jgi:molybdenum cofactor guanylyltransferase
VLPHVQDLLSHDQLRPAFLFERASTLRIPVDELKIVDPHLTTLRNLNRPEDYLAALKEAGFQPKASILAAFEKIRT